MIFRCLFFSTVKIFLCVCVSHTQLKYGSQNNLQEYVGLRDQLRFSCFRVGAFNRVSNAFLLPLFFKKKKKKIVYRCNTDVLGP